MNGCSHCVSCRYFPLMTCFRVFSLPCTSGCASFMHLDRCSCLVPATALLLWFGKNIFVPKHTLNSSSVCCLTERGVPSPHPCLAGADGAVFWQSVPRADLTRTGEKHLQWETFNCAFLPFSLQKSFQLRTVLLRVCYRTHHCLGCLGLPNMS